VARARLTGAFSEFLVADTSLQEAERDPRFNSALARGFQILRAFRIEDSYLGNVEIARRTRIPKATVSRLTFTLHQLGYLNFLEQIGKYEIAPEVLSLGHLVLAKAAIRTQAFPVMHELANEAEAVVALGMRDRLSVINIEYAKAPNAITRDFSIGYRLPLAKSATGLACLAAMRPQERAIVLEKLKRTEGSNWAKRQKMIELGMASVWSRGFCTSLGDLDPVFNAVAVPYLDHDGDRIYIFSCFGPSFRFTERALRNKWGPKLVSMVSNWNVRARMQK